MPHLHLSPFAEGQYPDPNDITTYDMYDMRVAQTHADNIHTSILHLPPTNEAGIGGARHNVDAQVRVVGASAARENTTPPI